MHITLSANYYHALKKFVANNKKNAQAIKKALTLFKENPNHPSLNLEKLQNTKGVYTVRLINKSDRIFFVWIEKNTVLFIDIGKHDKYRKF